MWETTIHRTSARHNKTVEHAPLPHNTKRPELERIIQKIPVQGQNFQEQKSKITSRDKLPTKQKLAQK